MKNIRVAIVGVGSCAKSLVEGIQYYTENPQDKIGLMYEDIGGYKASDIKFVAAFDIDKRKVGFPLKEALRAKPNCSMNHVTEITNLVIEENTIVHSSPVMDGVADYMLTFPEDISFRLTDKPAISFEEVVNVLKTKQVDVIVNYLPVGSEEASRFYLDAALEAGCHFVNCIPTIIDTASAMEYEQKFIDKGLTSVMSDMRSGFGGSRLSEVLQGSMLDSGLLVTQHIQMNMAAGSTQGQENIRTGRTANTDFLNMSEKYRLKNKHISKENVLKGQNVVRNESIDGMTMFAGPSLTVQQKPGGTYIGSDNKICNIDMVAYGFAGSRYELTARLSVQDSSNSGSVTISAIRFCKVASEMGIVGSLRGPSAWLMKTPALQLTSADAKFECDALARKILTPNTEAQLKHNNPKASELLYTLQQDVTDYE